MNKYIGISPSRAHVIVKHCGQILSEGCTVVEFGAANGDTLINLQNSYGAEVHGFDREPYESGILPIKKFDLEYDHFSDHAALLSRADLILFFDVLEHVRDPSKILNEITRYISDTAVIIVVSPRFTSLRMLKAWITGYMPEAENGFFDSSHFKWLSPKWIEINTDRNLILIKQFHLFSTNKFKATLQRFFPTRLTSQFGCVLKKSNLT